VQGQGWLGYHKPSFTLDTYVHLPDGEAPDPTFYDDAAGIATPAAALEESAVAV
jgi:hypothetical protein